MEGITIQTRVPNQQIALRGVRLRSAVAALAERATVEQTFVNLEAIAIEAIYTFPLPEDAAVCHFEVVTGDRVLTGVVDETERAIEKYDAAIDRGDAAYLLEQERPDVFTIRVGNINPKQAATVRLTYVRPLKVVDRQVRLAYPTTIAPRYVTATGSKDPLEAQIDGDAVNPPHAGHVPYGMSIEIDLDLGAAVASVTSPSHAISVRDENENHCRRRVTFAGGMSEMNRDLVLDIRLAKEQRPGVVVVKGDPARGGGGGGGGGAERDHFMALTFMPEFPVEKLAAPEPAETVFVLDCSGSMQGESTRQAISALELCLRSLGAGDTFNICRFGSTFELMRSEPLHYGGETLRQALQYIGRDADLGGTELFPPLQAIFQTPPATGSVRNIVLLTDGQVSNEPEVIALARQHRAHNRIFSFGIGAAVSAELVNGLARATGGAAEFITAGERIDEKVLRVFGRMASPMVRDVEIDWGGADVQTLAEIPPIFDGDAVAIYARTLGSPPKDVTLKCKLVGGAGGAGGAGAGEAKEMKWTLPVGYAIPDPAGVISTMWARRAIQSFEEVNGVRRTSARLREQSRDRDRLIALSKQFNLVCSLTSFIAVEHRTLEERNAGQPAVRRVPVMIAKGWGGMAAGGQSVAALNALMAAPQKQVRYNREVSPALIDAELQRRREVSASRGAPRQLAPRRNDGAGGGPGGWVPHETIDRSSTVGVRAGDDSADELEDVRNEADRMQAERVAELIAEALHFGAEAIDIAPAADGVNHATATAGEARRVIGHVPRRRCKPLPTFIKQLCGLSDTVVAAAGAATTPNAPPTGSFAAKVDDRWVMLPVTFTSTPHGEAIRIDLPASQPGIRAIERKLHKPTVRLLKPEPDALMAMLTRQTAEGAFDYWPADGSTARFAQVDEELQLLRGGSRAEVGDAVMHTMLCLLSMQTAHAARRDLWQRAHAKGVRYVAQALGVPAEEIAARVETLSRKLGAPEAPAAPTT